MVTVATIAHEFAAIIGFWCSRTSSVLVGDGPIGGMSATVTPSRRRAPVHFYSEYVGQTVELAGSQPRQRGAKVKAWQKSREPPR